MEIVKYISRKTRMLAKQIVRGLPSSRLERIRKERAKLQAARKSHAPLENMLAEEVGRRKAVEEELEKNKELYTRVKMAGEALRELEEAKCSAIYLHHIGPASQLGRFADSEKAYMEMIVSKANINKELDEQLRESNSLLEKKSQELDEVGQRAFNAEIDKIAKPYDSIPWMIYAPGAIIKSSKSFDKRFRDKMSLLSEELNRNNELNKRLAKGETAQVKFGKGYLLFEPRVKDPLNNDPRTVAVASYQPTGTFARFFAKNTSDAVSEINKYLGGIHMGLIGVDKDMRIKYEKV
jgi:hypothetical protein